jgi:hypothetical protein
VQSVRLLLFLSALLAGLTGSPFGVADVRQVQGQGQALSATEHAERVIEVAAAAHRAVQIVADPVQITTTAAPMVPSAPDIRAVAHSVSERRLE